MNPEEKRNLDVRRLAEENFVEAPANLSDCTCAEEHHLHVALSEQRGRPQIFSPDHVGMNKAYCATHGRRCDV
ncbi:MAG TPA: hypothetical protein VMC85_22065 [Desulfomonilaceae bacterium]|nr:hypothetical protein [Desulfomonilaceae bacterium]